MRQIVLIALVFTLLAALFQGVGIGFMLTFLQSLVEPDAEPLSTGIQWFDTAVLGNQLNTIERVYRVCASLLLVLLMEAICIGTSVLCSGRAQSQLIHRLKRRIFYQLQALNLDYYTSSKSGNLVNNLTTEINELKTILEIIDMMFARGTILAVYMIAMMFISWELTIAISILFACIAFFMSKLFSMLREVSFAISRERGEYTSSAIEFINGIQTIQVSCAQFYELRKIDDKCEKLLAAENNSWKIKAIIDPIPGLLVSLTALSILIFSFAVLIPNGQLQVASLLTMLFVVIRTLPLVRQLNNARSRLSRYQGAVNSIRNLLSVEDKDFFQNGSIQLASFDHGITFKNVSFSYNGCTDVLRDIDLTINSQETTALVGSSGAGKSTLADLLLRFYDPTQGAILIDGVDLRDLDINSLRQRIAFVSQDTFIFNTTVRENIAYAIEGVTDSMLIDVAIKANALQFIKDLPQGFDTKLGDRGVLLSGGQRQRIAIARALLRNPEILILDEATSALDSVSEKLIQTSIESLSKSRTVIAIAHRLSTISQADKVVVLEQGRIVEQGTYQELLDLKSRLWEYHRLQN